MQIDLVKEYLTSTVKTPYFMFVSDSHYKPAIDELLVLGFDPVRTSNFCGGDDKLPDIDGLFDYIETAGVNVNSTKLFVIGLGEYLALRGNDESSRILSRLKDLNVGGVKVVLILRGLVSQIAGLQADPRFDNRRYSVADNADCYLSFTLTVPSVGLSAYLVLRQCLRNLKMDAVGA
jgi:hypothetical protein